ncbi:Odorant receptor 76 [Frankliniella occidentalis]|nr:Odorant receptor 76 [Frankliniella occidentalis]
MISRDFSRAAQPCPGTVYPSTAADTRAREPERQPLTNQLEWWLWLLSGPHVGIHQRALAWGRGNLISVVLSVMTTGLMVLDSVLSNSLFSSTSILAARIACSTYSCVSAQLVFMRRHGDLCGILHNLARLTGDLEPRAHQDSQVHMRRSATLNARLVRFLYFYGWTTVLFLSMLFASIKPLWIAESTSALMRMAGDSSLTLSSRLTVLFDVNDLEYVLSIFQGLVQLVLGFILELIMVVISLILLSEQGGSRSWPSPLRDLLDVLLHLEDTFADVLPHFLVVSVALPVLSTVEVVVKGAQADAFAFLNAPLIFGVFVPMCMVGDKLSAARFGLSRNAFRGPWLEEDQQQKKMLLALMQIADGRGGQIRGTGIGRLNRSACTNAMKSWFSCLQVLINVQWQSAATVK